MTQINSIWFPARRDLFRPLRLLFPGRLCKGIVGQKYLSLIPVLLVLLGASACFESKVITSKVNPAKPGGSGGDMNGVFYALPRTIVKAEIPVVRTIKQPGAVGLYTPCFMPDSDFVVRKQSSFAIDAANVKLDTMFIPDVEEIYMIKTKGGMFETRNLEMSLTESGVLIKASAEVTDDRIDIVTGTIKTAAGLLAKSLPILLAPDPAQVNCRKTIVSAWEEELELAPNTFFLANGDVNEAALSANPQIPTQLKNLPDFVGGYEKAEDVSNQIKAFETRRTTVLGQPATTQPAVRAETVKLVLDELDKKIAELKTYFLGAESKIAWNPSFRFNPAPGTLEIDLFTLSKEHGVCSIAVNQGVQPDPRFKIAKECPGGAASCKPAQMVAVACTGQVVKLAVAPGENGEGGAGGDLFANKVNAANLKQTGNRGFFYRIPGRAIALVKQGPTELGRAPLSIAQFGKVVSLPASTGGRKTKYTLELYEASGGLKNFSLGSSALIQQKNIDDLAGATTTLIEAKGERNKAKAPADELQQLERQRKILEERKKIRDLENELNEGETPDEPQSP